MYASQVIVTEQIEVAKSLIDQRRLDFDAALTMLNALPGEIGEIARSNVEQAFRTVAAAADRDSRYEALARFAVARVVVSLEQYLAETVPTRRRGVSFDRHGVVPFGAIGSRMIRTTDTVRSG